MTRVWSDGRPLRRTGLPFSHLHERWRDRRGIGPLVRRASESDRLRDDDRPSQRRSLPSGRQFSGRGRAPAARLGPHLLPMDPVSRSWCLGAHHGRRAGLPVDKSSGPTLSPCSGVTVCSPVTASRSSTNEPRRRFSQSAPHGRDFKQSNADMRAAKRALLAGWAWPLTCRA